MRESYLSYHITKTAVAAFMILFLLTGCSTNSVPNNSVESAYASPGIIKVAPYNRSIISSINF